MQACAYALAGLDSVTNVPQVFHRDHGGTGLDRRLDEGPARFVIDVLHVPHLVAGDLPALVFGALAAVGLKTAAQGKVTVAVITQALTAEDFAKAVGGEVVFTDIYTLDRTGCHELRVARFHN